MAKKDLSRQKKVDTRIDFTPMVDMNMLLITFFMLCTTMLKSQTLAIALPTNNDDQTTEQNKDQAGESQAFTIIVDGAENTAAEADGQFLADPTKSKFYYYEGKLNLADPNSFQELKAGTPADMILELRKVLQKKNASALQKLQELKDKWKKQEFDPKNADRNDSLYTIARDLMSNQLYAQQEVDKRPPIVMIKPTARASYSDVVAMLDEMSIDFIGTFQLEQLSKDDSTALQQKGVDLSKIKPYKKQL